MILTGSKIIEEVENGNIHIKPYTPEHISVNSYDVTLSDKVITYTELNPNYNYAPIGVHINNEMGVMSRTGKSLDVKEQNKTYNYTIPDDGIVLYPGVLYLMQTNEECGSTVYQPCYDGRSSMARLGIQSHISAGFGDVGFTNKWTLEVTVVHPIRIYKNIRIGQVYFNKVDGDIKLYKGKYGVGDVIASESYRDFR